MGGPGLRYRTLFLSDIHLGTRGCQATLLLDFLDHHDADTLYLVGDIFDGWRLSRNWHWPQRHNDVVTKFLDMARDGTRIFYIPGNHDEIMRRYLGTHFGGIEVMESAEFTAANDKRYLVIHGDQFDNVVMNAKWLAYLGDSAYVTLLWMNTWINKLRWLWGGQYWSLSKWAKRQVKQAVNFISAYEDVLTGEAKRGGYDGVVCGHIHSAALHPIGAVEYVNTGDWVESCTAVVEREDGSLHLIDWASSKRRRNMVKARSSRKKGGADQDPKAANWDTAEQTNTKSMETQA
ncbi:MAG: UDP-2,3-diacylglucosamine diphosphatase [Pseudomonadota bacterium]